MKKLLLLSAFLLVTTFTKAQSADQAIADLHSLLNSARTNFASDIAAKFGEDAESKTDYYNTKRAAVGAKSIIMKMPDNKYTYAMIYDIRAEGALDKVLPIVTAYTAEIESMVKSGKYIKTKTEDGNDTTVKDKKGNTVLEFSWNIEFVNIYISGLAKQNKI